jgi:hypothetical protein
MYTSEILTHLIFGKCFPNLKWNNPLVGYTSEVTMHPDATLASDNLCLTGAAFCNHIAETPTSLPDVSDQAENSVKLLVLAALRVRHHLSTAEPIRCRTIGDLHAVRFDIRQNGCIYIVWNPTDAVVSGGIIPSFPELTLGPQEGRIVATDEPIGPSESLLSAYSGLVKSTATVISAEIRPDPYAGACVVIGGRTGDTHDVILFHRAGGEHASITIAATPTVHTIADNLVIAVPDHLRRYMVTPSGVTSGSYFINAAGEISTWMNTEIEASGELTGRLDPVPLDVIINNYPAQRPDDITLTKGSNTLRVRYPGTTPPENTLFLPDAACWCGELAPWRIESA